MTRMSKQDRRRARCPRKRRPKYAAQTTPLAPRIPYKTHVNAISGDGIVFIPKIS